MFPLLFLFACLNLPAGPALTLQLPHRLLFGVGSTVQATVRAVDDRPVVLWSTADPAVATIDPTGQVTATGFGSTTICAEWLDLRSCQTLRVLPDVPAEISSSRTIAIVGVNVVPMLSDAILERRTVLIRDGRIVAIGRDLPIPEDAERIDADGMFLMPGLADMHTHFLHNNPHWRNDLFLYAANGITTVREMWGSLEFLSWRSADLFSPFLYLASPGMDGPETPYGNAPVTTPAQARALVAAYKRVGYDFIKVYTDLRLDVYQAILEEAARQSIPVIGHAPTRIPYETVIASGQSSVEHLSGFWRQPELDRLTALLRDSSTFLVPTVFVSDRNTAMLAELRQRPEYRYVSPEMRRWFDTSRTAAPDRDLTDLRRNLRLTLRKLHDAHVRLMLGTDSGFGYITPGFAIHDEFRAAVEAGLTPYEALRMATLYPAWYLGTLDRAGSAEPGKRADLLLLEENPLDDVANAAKRVAVLIGGWWQSEKNLRARLDQIAREYVQP